MAKSREAVTLQSKFKESASTHECLVHLAYPFHICNCSANWQSL